MVSFKKEEPKEADSKRVGECDARYYLSFGGLSFLLMKRGYKCEIEDAVCEAAGSLQVHFYNTLRSSAAFLLREATGALSSTDAKVDFVFGVGRVIWIPAPTCLCFQTADTVSLVASSFCHRVST